MNTYPWHSVVKVTVTFKDPVTGKPIDPASPYLTVVDPQGNRTTPVLTHSSTGIYTAALPCDASGVWSYQGFADGTGQSGTPIRQFNIARRL